MRLSPLLLAAFVLFTLPACKKPKAGDPCSGSSASCLDPSSALFCASGTLKPMTCSGPAGCKAANNVVICDDTVAQVGDGCDEENEVACQTDKKAALECKGGLFAVGETCKGPHGCVVDGEKITCDNDVADENDPCHFDGDYACSSDKTMAFKCVGKKMTPLNSCRGPKGCMVLELPIEHKVQFDCDDSIAKLGDACDENGELACTMEKTALMICSGNKFTAHKACGGPKGCSFDAKGAEFDCDTTAQAGATMEVKKPEPAAMPHKPAATPAAKPAASAAKPAAKR